MTATLGLRSSVRALLAAALAAGCALVIAAPLAQAAEPAIAYTKESIGSYEKQLAAGEIKEVTINKRLRSLRTTLKNGEHVLAKYAKKQEPKYAAALEAKGVPLKTLTPTQATAEAKSKPVHHKLRYIAAAVLVAILIIVGVVLFVNRRRKAVLD